MAGDHAGEKRGDDQGDGDQDAAANDVRVPGETAHDMAPVLARFRGNVR
jgi:hypothetical protein